VGAGIAPGRLRPFPAGSSRLSQPNRVHLSLRSIWFFSLLPTPPHGDAVTSSSRRHIGCQRPRSLTLKEDAALQRTGMALRAVRRSACQLSGAIIRKPALTDSTTERAGNGTRSVTPKVQDFVDCAYPKKHLGCDRNPMWGMVSERDPAPSRSLVIFTLLVIVTLLQIWIEIIK
jgi:hypothetical protein